MIRNEGSIDRAIRILAGLALFSQVFTGYHPWLAFFGGVLLATGFLGFCPLYRLLNIRTCPVRAA